MHRRDTELQLAAVRCDLESGKALGYKRMLTYTQADETGASLRAVGWRRMATRRARKGWDTPSRGRDNDEYMSTERVLWQITTSDHRCDSVGADDEKEAA